MTEAYSQPLDIANRALQHCGVPKISALTENSKAASEINLCYDKLRVSELRRNVWRFSTKKAVLYPINTEVTGLKVPMETPVSPATVTSSLPTMLLYFPQPWSSTKDYNFGAVVVDTFGTLWQSTIPHNIGQTPGGVGILVWEIYTGSVCVQPYDSTVAYYAGDSVYVTGAQGENMVFTSLENGNTDNPTTPTPWVMTTTYQQGSVVVDSAGYFWQSLISLNTGNQPGFYGNWRSADTYPVGFLVIGSDQQLYQALVSTTNVNPANGANPTDWLALGNPGSYPVWQSTVSYVTGDFVCGSDGQVYRAVQGNVGHNPVGSTYNPLTPATNYWLPTGKACPWNGNFSSSSGAGSWVRQTDATVQPLNISYPVGSGPSTQNVSRNVYMLPNAFLRHAPQDPKAGSSSFLGAPTGNQYDDWVYEGQFIVTREARPIVFRFVADVTQVGSMDPMFCEGLAARIAKEVCEPLTQASDKLDRITAAYNTVMGEARGVNGIETGSVEPAEDDWISCRY